ncbi:MAG TPA: hypothetical protein VMV57_13630 [Terracidiphilus sp.]|nr:hypothetical protein [Terracidiphilus sp.]
MKTMNWKLLPAVVSLLLGCAAVPGAFAQCGLSYKAVKPMSWHPLLKGDQDLSLVRVNFGPSIVGMWHEKFTAQAMNDSPIPDTVIDDALSQWHSDGTEIMNSARPAQDGNFCLGVWTQIAPSTYFLNHIPWKGNDTANAETNGIGNPQGGAQILEKVVLSHNGNSFTGSFKLTAYNPDGSVAIWFTGALSGTRITPATTFGSLLP